MKKKFTEYEKPLITGMIQCRTAEECIDKIKRSIAAGAEALGVQLCQLGKQERTDEKLKSIFDACGEYPIYITSYRNNINAGMTDEECAELLLKGLKNGADLCDIFGDMFDKNDYQVTHDPTAVKKQRELIDKIHSLGGEVLISTHDLRELNADEIYKIALTQKEVGADVIKIVVRSADIGMMPQYVGVIQKMQRELGRKFLFLDGGACGEFIRRTGIFLGCCTALCVESHSPLDTAEQPPISQVKAIRENMHRDY